MSNWNTCDFQDINCTFITKEEGKKLITQHDSYIDNLTQLDLDCRCDKRGATLDQYLKPSRPRTVLSHQGTLLKA